MDDVTLGVGLDETAWRGTQGASHVGDEETTIHCQFDCNGCKSFQFHLPFWLGADLISNGAEQGSVAVRELGMVWVAGVPVESSVLSLEQRQKTTTDKSLSVQRNTQVMGRVTARGDVGNVDDGTEGILLTHECTAYWQIYGRLTSSKLVVTRKSLWWLSPAPVQKWPTFLGLMLETSKGGLSKGGVGIWRMGKGGARPTRGSVTPGMAGIRGGRERPRAFSLRMAAETATEEAKERIFRYSELNELDEDGLEGVVTVEETLPYILILLFSKPPSQCNISSLKVLHHIFEQWRDL